MEISDDLHCFVCGPENPRGLGASFHVNRENGTAACTLTIPRDFQGWRNVIHGGIIASLLDEAAIYACKAFGEHFVTAEFTVRYKHPVPAGEMVTIKAEVTERRRKLYRVRSHLECAGVVCAEAEAKIFSVPEESR